MPKVSGHRFVKPFATFTFGNKAEHHAGMEMTGKNVAQGIPEAEFPAMAKHLRALGFEVELVDLSAAPLKHGQEERLPPACVLVVRHALQTMAAREGGDAPHVLHPKTFLEKTMELPWDRKFLNKRPGKNYDKVLNKQARYNLVFDGEGSEANYEKGRGTVVAFRDFAPLEYLRRQLPSLFGPSTKDLVAEGNLYFDSSKCGIGFHGDGERRVVVAVRLGESSPLHYRWYKKTNTISEDVRLVLDAGDMYVMSEKAVGHDWKKQLIPTLRHAAGKSYVCK